MAVFTGDWYPWYAEKALTSETIDGLSLAEEGAYRRALDKVWLKGSIPADPKEAARVIGKGCTARIASRILKLPHFRPMPGSRKRLIHTVLERVRAEQCEKHKKRVDAANKRRKLKPNENGHAVSNATAMHKQCHTDKESSDLLDKEEEIKRLIDRACACETNAGFDKRLVEIAVIETMLRRQNSTNGHRPIKSVRYFSEEIRTMVDKGGRLGTKAIDAMLHQRRKQAGLSTV